ncbi:MAG: hypothetical protein ACREDR_34355 [Blastocatellia bacterium]
MTVPHVVGDAGGPLFASNASGSRFGSVRRSGNSPPAFGAVLEIAHSRIPALSYGVAYAIGNMIVSFRWLADRET